MNIGTISKNLFWKFSERISAQLVTLIVSIVLARLLMPSDYGAVSLIMVFISFTEVFITNGFGVALIQKKGADDLDYSTVFYSQLVLSILLYGLVFISAPIISNFYGEEYYSLTPMLRVLGLRLIISSINNVQHSYVSKHMIFKKFFWSTLIGTIISALVGVFLAIKGFGTWAIIGQYLTNSIIDTIVLFVTLPWKPKFVFSFSRLKTLFKFSYKITLSSLIDTTYSQSRSLIIGKMYSADDLAYYNKGKQFPDLIENNVNVSIESVLFPAISNKQEDTSAIKRMMQKSISICSYVMCPLLIGLAAVAPIFVSLLLTDKWLQCVPFMQIYCIVLLFNPIHTANIQAIKAVGRSDIVLKLNILNKIVGIITLIISLWYGPVYIAISLVFNSIVGIIINTFPNKRLFDYSLFDQLSDIFPSFLFSVVMFVPVYLLGSLNTNRLVLLLLQAFVGAFIYLVLSIVFKPKAYIYVKQVVSGLFRRKK